MKVAVVQMSCSLGDTEENIRRITRYANHAKENGCQVAVFPEMADTGYDMSVIRENALTWEDEGFRGIGHAAQKNKLHIICGISEREGETIYNTAAVFDPEGELIGKYRKIHLAAYPPLNEGSVITAGNSLETVNILDLTLGLQICYDIRFPEMSRSLTLAGAELLVISSAWPFPRLRHWETLLRARAIENQAYVVAANRVGTDNGVTFCGSSRIIDPYGVVVASAAENREEMIMAELNVSIIRQVREMMPVFQHRRPDVYRT